MYFQELRSKIILPKRCSQKEFKENRCYNVKLLENCENVKKEEITHF